MLRGLLVLFLAGCANLGPLQQDHRSLVADISKAEANKWALECAPEELALAHSHRGFAELEFKQGDARRATQHVELARENIRLALDKAAACTPQDRDDDGIVDADDRCPDVPEDYDGFMDDDGCPDLDRDEDGIQDDADACPDEPEDVDNHLDTDGCPDYDNDNDGLVDVADACPDMAEDLDGDRDDDGCPEDASDRDGDSIVDAEDRCPDEGETFNEYLDEDGCPDTKPQKVKVTRERIEITEKIMFEVAKARILPQSYGLLNQVAQVLQDYPQIKIRIEGHTDSDGSDGYNQKLSQSRAESVYNYIVAQGIEKPRLESVGFGETRPIDTNRTREGKANNRRVEFHITEGM